MDAALRIPYEYILVNLAGQIILALVYFNFGSGPKRSNNLGDRLYNTMLFANFLVLTMDSIAYFLNGIQDPTMRIANIISCGILYMIYPIMYLIWPIYCEYQLFANLDRFKRRLPLVTIIAFIFVGGTIISCFTPFFFYIDEYNIYHRGPAYGLHFILGLFQVLYAFWMTLRVSMDDDSGLNSVKYRTLLIFPLFPLLGAIFQYYVANISSIWLGVVISFLYAFFNMQSAQITQDSLTSLSNRRRFDSYLEQKIQSLSNDEMLFLLMMDMNKFKEINDKYGHLTGDMALKSMANILIAALPRNDFLARVGGDEFAVIGIRRNQEEVNEAISSIENKIYQFNELSDAPYNISLSIGCSTMTCEKPMTMAEIINCADEKMYEQKRLFKALSEEK